MFQFNLPVDLDCVSPSMRIERSWRSLAMWLLLSCGLVLGGCMSEGQLLLVNIEGVDAQSKYNQLPNITLDYAGSVENAKQNDTQTELEQALNKLQVLINGKDLHSAFDFKASSAFIRQDQKVLNALKVGNNSIEVKTAQGNILDTVSFTYQPAQLGVYLGAVSKVGSQLEVTGFAQSGSEIVSVELNNRAAKLVDDQFTVRVPIVSNYTLIVEDSSGQREVKRYVKDVVLEQGARIRVHEDFLNQAALRQALVKQLGGSVNIDTQGINPVVDIKIPLASVKSDLANPLKVGDLAIQSMSFAPSNKDAKLVMDMDLSSAEAQLSSAVKAGFVSFNLNTIAKIKRIAIDLDIAISSNSNNQLVAEPQNVRVDVQGLSIEMPGLPKFLSAIVSPVANAFLPVFQKLIDKVVLDGMQAAFSELSSEAVLSSIIKTDTSMINSQISSLSSDTNNMFLELQLANKARKNTQHSIGIIASKKASNFNANKLPNAFSQFDSSLNVNTAEPSSAAGRNLSVVLSAEFMNQVLHNAYTANNFTAKAYMVNGNFKTSDKEPKHIGDGDIRLLMGLQSPMELSFSGNSSSVLNTQIVAPNVEIRTHIYQSGRWNKLGTLHMYAQIPARVDVNNKGMRLKVNRQGLSFNKLKLDADEFVQLFEPMLDEALLQIKPELADMIEETAVYKFDFSGSKGVDKVQVHVNKNQHMEVDMRVNYAKAF